MIGKLIDPVADILGKFIPDADKKNALAHEIATMAEQHAQSLALAQIEVNKAEATNSSLFVAGWRPFIGWTCGTALAWHFVLEPMIGAAFAWAGVDAPELPAFDMQSLMTILTGMLGLGGLRTFEKYKGVSK
jgi:hypothetical protein